MIMESVEIVEAWPPDAKGVQKVKVKFDDGTIIETTSDFLRPLANAHVRNWGATAREILRKPQLDEEEDEELEIFKAQLQRLPKGVSSTTAKTKTHTNAYEKYVDMITGPVATTSGIQNVKNELLGYLSSDQIGAGVEFYLKSSAYPQNVFTAVSKSSGKQYELIVNLVKAGGIKAHDFTCNCKGWTRRAQRQCKHTLAFENTVDAFATEIGLL